MTSRRFRSQAPLRWLRRLALQFALVAVACALATPAGAQEAKTFSKEQLDQMLAPIALYPDSLLSQVLMASTYPSDVAEAVAWSKANPNQKGDAAVKAVESKNWDPSVQSLVAFPQVLATMGEKPEWVQSLGDAFLAQPDELMDEVQRLRAAAQKEGSLKTTEQQKVVVEPAAETQQTVIKIEPANPQVVYVPVYNPTVVYGAWWYPAYPPYYWPPPPGYAFGSALAAGIAFGTGIAITNALWGGFNWGRHDVNINVNRYNNINVNRKIDVNQTNVSWKHNAENRRGVPYRDAKSREQYGKQLGGADARQDFRGRDASREASRQQAQAALQQRGMDPARERQQLRNDPQARERAQTAARNTSAQSFDRSQARANAQNFDRSQARSAAQGPRDNALRGAGNAGQTRQAVNRGQASRQSMAHHGGGGRAGAGARGGGRRR